MSRFRIFCSSLKSVGDTVFPAPISCKTRYSFPSNPLIKGKKLIWYSASLATFRKSRRTNSTVLIKNSHITVHGLSCRVSAILARFLKNCNIARNCSNHLKYKNKKINTGEDALFHTDRRMDSRYLEIFFPSKIYLC